jgi:YVTN family beta-propeller protein
MHVALAGSGRVAAYDITTLPSWTFLGNPVVGSRPAWVAFTPDGTRSYVTNFGGASVSVIDTTTIRPSVIATVTDPAFVRHPYGIAVNPNGTRAYVVNTGQGLVTGIDTDPTSPTYNTVVDLILVGGTLTCQEGGVRSCPGVAFAPDGTRAYVTAPGSNSVFAIDADPTSPTYRFVVANITVGNSPGGIAITPSGSQAYVTNAGAGSNNVSVIDTDPTSPTFHLVVATIPVGNAPWGVAFTPDGTRAYVANSGGNTVSVIDTTTSPPRVVNTVTVGSGPLGRRHHTVLKSLPARADVWTVIRNGGVVCRL